MRRADVGICGSVLGLTFLAQSAMAQVQDSPQQPPRPPPERYEEVPDAAAVDRRHESNATRNEDGAPGAPTPDVAQSVEAETTRAYEDTGADTQLGADDDLKPALPEGMSLAEALAMAEQSPRADAPHAIRDHRLLAFLLADQFEYRVGGGSPPDAFGWRANAWIGGDFNRVWFKPEGAMAFSEPGLESETDVLYSRLVLPFWSVQVGAQYANQWSSGQKYEDRWSGAVAFQGLLPGKFEAEVSLYVSERADFTSVLELEYDWRVTQRLVVQPRTELAFAFQDIPQRNMGAGLTDVVAGVRVRYEFKREFAPYLGARYEGKTFETVQRTRSAGGEVWRAFGLVGIRFAFL